MTIGSCFSDNIGKKLQQAFFQTAVNPFGVLYNPVSVAQSLNILVDKTIFTEKDIFEYNSLWHSFSHSSFYSNSDKNTFLKKINESSEEASCFLSKTNHLIITLGTAWVFELIKTGKVVSNCHKLPANDFNRRRLTVNEVVGVLSQTFEKLYQFNPQLDIILTVSPIRHWKDGAHENNLSKSTLHLAIDELVNKYSYASYFPSYEIQMDELRDYRFYAADMMHPSETAIDYIWQRFSETYFDKETMLLKKELEQLRADLNHRPIHPESAEYHKFMMSVEKRKVSLIKEYPELVNLLNS